MTRPAVTLHLGDCLDVLRQMPEASVDAVVTDPPYGLSFMGKRWDYDVPSVEVWAECLRVLKPGGHLLSFAGTRTQHRMAARIEDAGFEIRDLIAWVYGSGFPKSLDVSKAIDKAAGRMGHATESIKGILRKAHKDSGKTLAQLNESCGFEASGYLRDSSTWANVLPPQDKWPVIRDALGLASDLDSLFAQAEREVVGQSTNGIAGGSGRHVGEDGVYGFSGSYAITAPATDAARQWAGWGTALKPALEPITVARKPLAGTVAETVLAYGTGAINVDGCRVWDGADKGDWPISQRRHADVAYTMAPVPTDKSSGRWPSNLIHDGGADVADLLCDAARFFYTPKASRADRDAGCGDLPQRTAAETVERAEGSAGLDSPRAGAGRTSGARNHHPTVKPTDLMRYLCRLVTRPGGVVLDPFMGSGSTGRGAVLEGFRFVGIEREADYLTIAQARIEAAQQDAQAERPQLSLFDQVAD